jgi:hypothetical protein
VFEQDGAAGEIVTHRLKFLDDGQQKLYLCRWRDAMQAKVNADLVTLFAAGFLTAALAISLLSEILFSTGWLNVSLKENTGLQAIIAGCGGVVSIWWHRRATASK